MVKKKQDDTVKNFLEMEGGSIEILLDKNQHSENFKTFITKINLPNKLIFQQMAVVSAKETSDCV